MKLWRCNNPKCADDSARLGHDFAAEVGKCDKCGIGTDHPRFGSLIIPRVVVHFDPPSEVDGIGLNTCACDPAKKVGSHRATGEPTAVTCPACRETEKWETARKAVAVSPEHDFSVTMTADGPRT